MPIHDWSRVNAGLFHHFHQRWIAALCDHLNAGVLPEGFFALAEQSTSGPILDVLTPAESPEQDEPSAPAVERGIAVATAPPRTRFTLRADPDLFAAKANRIAVRHPLGRVVALIEIVSPGNKASRAALRGFVEKAVGFLGQGIHLLVIDLFPPSARDPQGIHRAIWSEISDEPFAPPPDKPLTLASYDAGPPLTAYVEPVAVGDDLPEMPVFLDPARYVPCPLEPSYRATWDTCPRPLREAVPGSRPVA